MILNNQSLKVNIGISIFALLLLFYLTFRLSFIPSWNAYSQYRLMRSELENQDEIDRDLDSLKRKLAKSGTQYQVQGSGAQTFESNLLYFMGQNRSQKEISQLRMSEVYQRLGEGYKIETIEIEMLGSYYSLVRLLHAVESDFKSATVVSAAIEKRKNLREKKEELIQKIYVQKITKLE